MYVHMYIGSKSFKYIDSQLNIIGIYHRYMKYYITSLHIYHSKIFIILLEQGKRHCSEKGCYSED